MYDAYDLYRTNEDLHPTNYPQPEPDEWAHAALIGSHECARDVHMRTPNGAGFMGCTECMAAHEALTGSQAVVMPDFDPADVPLLDTVDKPTGTRFITLHPDQAA